MTRGKEHAAPSLAPPRVSQVLVTGGAGFLGSHLCDRLIDAGYIVVCLDNFFTGSRLNVAHLLGHPRFELIRHDVTFPIYVEVDQIFNLACAETLFFDYHRQHGLKIKVARIFNTYGPRMHPDDGRVVSNFIRQALIHAPITIYGDGSQTRCFCYVSDMIEGLMRLMASPDEFSGPVNLGTPVEMSILELAERVIDLTNSRSNLVRAPALPDDPMRRCPDITLARERLGWSPAVGLDEGLSRTIEYFDALLGGAPERRPRPAISAASSAEAFTGRGRSAAGRGTLPKNGL